MPEPQSSPPPSSAVSEIRKGIPALAAATGAPAPSDGLSLPTVNVAAPSGVLCEEVAAVLHSAPIFYFAGRFVTVSEEGGMDEMGSNRFRSWVENHLAFVKWTQAGSKAESIGQDKAGVILASDAMRRHVREVMSVHSVRLPVWDGAGRKCVKLLPPGFDPETKVFTVDGIAFDTGISKDAAVAWFVDRLGEFPFYEGSDPSLSRSFSAAVAAMVGVFCRHLFRLRPMVVVNGNQPGTGKSKLARVILAPVHGALAEDDKPKSEEEMRKKLDSIAIDLAPYLLLDDCASLASNALNRFLTSLIHAGRVLSQSKRYKEPSVTQVLATGNGMNVTPDLARRCLVIDLFCAGEATARVIRCPMDDFWIQGEEFRGEALAALWGLVRAWSAAGCPRLPDPTGSTFSEYRAVVGGIVTHAGFCDPFASRECGTGGDESGAALEAVLRDKATKASDGDEWTPQDILDRAEEMGLADVILPYAVKDAAKSLGHKLRKLKGRIFETGTGSRFEFGSRKGAAGTSYPVRLIEDDDD